MLARTRKELLRKQNANNKKTEKPIQQALNERTPGISK